MSKIKNIYCFGTSFTAGGGFEWETNDRQRSYLLNTYYKNTPEPKKQFHYSWPGQLDKLLKDVSIHNLAKQGYGNDTIFRKCFDIVRDRNFDKDSSLFLFEFSQFGRKEFYYNKIKDYVICNYMHSYDNITQVDVGHSYYYDDSDMNQKLDELQPILESYMKNTFDEMSEYHKMSRDISFFLNWITSNKFNTIFVSEPKIYYEEDRKVIDLYPQIDYELSSDNNCFDIVSFITDGFRIKDETDNKFDDFHAGYETNKYISKLVFNKLVEMGYINQNKFDLEVEYNKAKNSKYNSDK